MIPIFLNYNKRRGSVETVNFNYLQLKYDEDGLIPVIVQDKETDSVLMMAWMNKTSLEKTIRTKSMVYWSRSRGEFWRKGETSGNTQELVDLAVDCDQDCLLARVYQVGSACHTNNKTCFFHSIKLIP